MRINVLGVGFDNMTMEQAVAEGVRLMNTQGAHYAVTPNPEIVEVCREDPEAMDAVNGADLVLADGIGVIYGARMLGTPLKGRVPGIEFAKALMASMAESGKSLFLLGAKPGVAEKAADNLRREYPGLKIAGVRAAYFQEDGPVVDDIRASGAEVVFVCLGAPKQEKWMYEHQGKIHGLMLGVGAGFDYQAGKLKRAPLWMQKMSLEWVMRLIQDPRRLWKRYLVTNAKFLWYVRKENRYLKK